MTRRIHVLFVFISTLLVIGEDFGNGIISLQTARKEKNLSVPFPPSVFSSVTHARTMVGPPGEGSRHGLGEQPETPATD